MAKRYTKPVDEGLTLVCAHAQAVVESMQDDQAEDQRLMGEALDYLFYLQCKKRKKPNAPLDPRA